MSSSDAKLQKVTLPPDVIDLSFGEPKVVTEALFREINRFGSPVKMPTLSDLLTWEYQPAAGKPDLVKILEDKYGASVVVCNGAKQALAASMSAFKRSGRHTIYYDSPYYPGNPSLAESVGLIWADKAHSDCALITSPNNPDGRALSNSEIAAYQLSQPTIHDAAYHTGIYLPSGGADQGLGDIQVFSVSKMYGLSGLRIGYAVVHNEKYYEDVVDYVEETTAGVSTASQDIVRNIELFFHDNPKYYRSFVNNARDAIALSRAELSKLDPDVLELIQPNTNSPFGWFKVGPAFNAEDAKVHMLAGDLFGQPGMARMNIAHPAETIREAVRRLNEVKHV